MKTDFRFPVSDFRLMKRNWIHPLIPVFVEERQILWLVKKWLNFFRFWVGFLMAKVECCCWFCKKIFFFISRFKNGVALGKKFREIRFSDAISFSRAGVVIYFGCFVCEECWNDNIKKYSIHFGNGNVAWTIDDAIKFGWLNMRKKKKFKDFKCFCGNLKFGDNRRVKCCYECFKKYDKISNLI